MIKAIFWDFDGVVAESVNVKTEAFYNLYMVYGEAIADKVRRHHLDNGGMSRFDKFRHYQADFLGQPTPIGDDVIADLASRFSELVLDGVIHAPFVSGVEKILRNKSEELDFYIISGTPTEEMRLIVRERHLDSYFKGVYGSPESKTHWCTVLMDQWGYLPEEIVFIGDAMSDYRAAKECGLTFLLRKHGDNQNIFTDYTGYAIKDFNDFASVFEAVNSDMK